MAKPDIPGLGEFGFDVDTYDGAVRLGAHLASGRGRGHAGRDDGGRGRCGSDRYRDRM